MKLLDFIGWIGVGLVLTAFFLITFGGVLQSDIIYAVLNILGAACIITSSYAKKDFQPVLLNIVWLLIAATGLVKNIS